MTSGPTILFAGGGTGGHLYPGIAVAQALSEIRSDAKPLFLCTTRAIDSTILRPSGFEFIEQPIVPPVHSASGLLRFWKSWRDTKDLVRRILRERKPAAVLGLGGYAAGVAVKVAASRGVKTAILNPDVIPGRANQYLMRYARAVCCQFEETRRRVSESLRSRLTITGCPIRRDLLALPARAEAAARLGLDTNLNTLVVTGASQGAATINQAMLALVGTIQWQGWQILHLSGADHASAVQTGYRQQNAPAVVIDFTPNMGDVWAVADLCVCRAGASTCAELTACGVASILMPYPFHKDMHQRANAQVLADAGAAAIVDDTKDATTNAAALGPIINSLMYDARRRAAMSGGARSLARPNAAAAVAQVVTKFL
ncbi:MAG: UDP-N-acetylglucosamine--N-acetylmuramyl-(pentapeptide) pyrophosphoryl-undecaprenol N-acetylglucosamine transferase [Tepidisphaeraceae bacterium]